MSSRRHLGWKPMPRNPSCSSSATALTSRRWLPTSRQVWWMSSSGAPDSSSCPAGSSVTEAPSRDSAITWPCSSTASQPNRVRPLSSASMPRAPSNGGGRRSSRRKPNFSCSVPMRQSPRGFSPEASTATSSSIRLTGVSPSWLGLDMRIALRGVDRIRNGPAFARRIMDPRGPCRASRRWNAGAPPAARSRAAAYEFIAPRIACASMRPLASGALDTGDPT